MIFAKEHTSKTGMEKKIVTFIHQELRNVGVIQHKASWQSDRNFFEWFTPEIICSLEIKHNETCLKTKYPLALLLPCEINDLVAEYVGFHEAFTCEEVFAAYLPVSVNIWCQFDPLHFHRAVEAPSNILAVYQNKKIFSHEYQTRENDIQFLVKMWKYAIVYENEDLVTFSDYFNSLHFYNAAIPTEAIWKLRFEACLLRKDKSLALKYKAQHPKKTAFPIDCSWLQFKSDRFFHWMIREKVVRVTLEFLEQLVLCEKVEAEFLTVLQQTTGEEHFDFWRKANILFDMDLTKMKEEQSNVCVWKRRNTPSRRPV